MSPPFYYQITNFRISYRVRDSLKDLLAAELELPVSEIASFQILKESLDARQNRKDIYYQYKILFSLKEPLLNLENRKNIEPYNAPESISISSSEIIPFQGKRPIIVGYGPAGMFAAYTLVNAGIKPIIIEKGQMVDERQKALNQLWKNSVFNPDSNVQFGEGGAGFYSDGKLYTRVSSPHVQEAKLLFILGQNQIFYTKTNPILEQTN